MKSLLLLWIRIAEESAVRCCTSATLDVKYVQRRYEHEGLSFLTITLPTFGKDFEKSLDQGQTDRNLFQGFPWQAGLPRLFGGFLDLVFDRTSGVLLSEPSVDAILAVRQLTLMFNKVAITCTRARERQAMDGYVQCEKEVREADRMTNLGQWLAFDHMAAMLYRDCFLRCDREIVAGELLPKHGPGATADRLRGNAKYRQQTWPSRLDKEFPIGDFLLPNYRYYDSLDQVDLLEPEAEVPVRVISVPKTLKTPRIIGIEPTAMQYCQQALNRSLLSSIAKDDNLATMLGFYDQEVNQLLAREGSLSGELATLDLSEASDRVSNQHVRRLLRFNGPLHGAVDACRSRKADVDGHGVLRLSKYASMGSALCFPMEAMVFLTMIFMGISEELSTPLSPRMLKAFRGKVRVYGDDIIVPVEYVRSVISVLESFGIKVNRGKSFWNGKFRESCGREYYDGEDVSIVRVRRAFPTSRKDAAEIISIVSLRNQLYFAGYWSTVRWLDSEIEKLLIHFPVVLPTSRALGRHSFLGFETQWMDENTHGPFVKAFVVHAPLPLDELDGEGALLKCLLQMEHRNGRSLADIESEASCHPYDHLEAAGLPAGGNEHLVRSGRPVTVNIKLRGVSAV